MIRRRSAILVLLAAVIAVFAIPAVSVRPAAAAEYTLETSAAYDVRPDEGTIGVTVQISFTNTTPDPPGQFSIFDQVKLAIHDEATDVTASDDEGPLDVTVKVEKGVNVATIELREDLRFEEAVDLELDYTLEDGDDTQLRVRPSVVVFPAWSFGTESQVSVAIPSGYDVRVDGDQLTEGEGGLVSGPIKNPAAWLALVTATRPPEYTAFDATVPLEGGTADLRVRAFVDDEAWGEDRLALVQRALPLIEEEIGLPYPRMGELVLTESVASNASGFAETASAGTEILVAFDQPEFTALHQVAHVWLSPELIESRWIREGLASAMAERVATELDVAPPYDPAEEATRARRRRLPARHLGCLRGPRGGGLRACRVVGVHLRTQRLGRSGCAPNGARARGELDRAIRGYRSGRRPAGRRRPAGGATDQPGPAGSPRGGQRHGSRRAIRRAHPDRGRCRAAPGPCRGPRGVL